MITDLWLGVCPVQGVQFSNSGLKAIKKAPNKLVNITIMHFQEVKAHAGSGVQKSPHAEA